MCGEVCSTAALPLALRTERETGWAPEPVEALKVEKNLLPLLGVEPPFLGCSAHSPVTTPTEALEGGYDVLYKSSCKVSPSFPLGFLKKIRKCNKTQI